MSTITREQAKDLRNAFQCWRQDYDPVEDKEQYDMFGLGMVAMDALLASLEAEPVAEVCEGFTLRYIGYGPAPKSGVHIGDRLFTAHPAPASVPDEAISRAVDEVMATYAGSADECRNLVRKHIEDACRAAMLHGSDTELQRKAAIHDALCEKYNVESLTNFVNWQRNHIAELEAASPAPVGEGETAVMPDYPGYTMTQRECFQAGKKAGLAEAGNSPVITDELIRRIAFSLVYLASDEMVRSDQDALNALVRAGVNEVRKELASYA